MVVANKEIITEKSAKKKRQVVYSKAGFAARKKALLSGIPVCFIENTTIYRMFPDGKKIVVGQAKQSVKISKKVFSL